MHSKPFLAGLFKTLYSIRVFETRAIELYRQGFVRGYLHPYLGEEAIATGVCAALEPRDYIASTHRGHGHCLARGAEPRRMFAELLGRTTGYCRGQGGSMHIADVTAGNLGANGIVGGGIHLGVGAALGTTIRGEDRVTVVFLSDGATNAGVFFESLNLAALWNLPLIVVIENNQYAVSTPIEKSTRVPELHRRAESLGVAHSQVDGNRVLEVFERAGAAVADCRAGRGPVLIEAKTFRHAGHHVNDPGLYMPKDRLDYYKAHDPVVLGRRLLLEQGGATEAEVRALEAAVEAEMEAAVAFAKDSPEPSVAGFLQSAAY
jgi:pyruvate dehydrogenase E1 component alpha subunit